MMLLQEIEDESSQTTHVSRSLIVCFMYIGDTSDFVTVRGNLRPPRALILICKLIYTLRLLLHFAATLYDQLAACIVREKR